MPLKSKIIYINYLDISQSVGGSINEREFLTAFATEHSSKLIYIGPKQKSKEKINLGIRSYSMELNKSIASQLAYQIWLFFTLVRIHLNNKNIIICCRPHFFSVSPIIFKKLFKTPFISKESGLGVDLMKKHVKLSPLQKKIAVKTKLINTLNSDKIWAVTDTIKNFWVNKGFDESEVFVSSNGANISIFKPDIKPEIPNAIKEKHLHLFKILFAGSLRKDVSGIPNLLNALKIVNATSIKAILIIAGDGPYKKELENISRRIGVYGETYFLGRLEYKSMPPLYNACDLLTALLDNTWIKKYGSSSQKVYQYIATGKDVLASKCDDHQFIEDNNFGLLADSDDVNLISKKIMHFIEKPPYTSSWRGFDYIENHYSYKSTAKSFYKQCELLENKFSK